MRRTLALAVAGVLAASGCGFDGVSSIPLPGGPDLGSHPYEVHIEFVNVLDLVPQATVKVDDVSVGRIEDIKLNGWKADVRIKLNGNVRLPDNATATIAQTSLLGEKFVALKGPATGGSGQLSDGDLIPITSTTQNTEVEEVLSALSMLLNGGGIEQISTITKELNAAMSGREETIKSVLNRVDTFVTVLDRQKIVITDALDKIDRLMVKLEEEKGTIADTIEKTEPAVRILRDNRADLTKMLVGLSKFSDVTSSTIKRSKKDFLANLKDLQPILKNINKSGDLVPKNIGNLLTFPFPDTFANTVRGDFANMNMTVSLDMNEIMHNLLTGTSQDKSLARSLQKQADALRNLITPPGTSLTQQPPGVIDLGDTPGPGGSVLPTIGMPDTSLDALLGGTS
ncbi:MCE family protein [Actinocorallia longicatena]|uniref:MCE family protein n=1 Tax=Actinocorallia longicatena TaxID=111803 RepID=A0ABP6QE69_9ACTN